MRIYTVIGHAKRDAMIEVSTHAEARAFLAKIGNVVVYDVDTMCGGADALVIPHGSVIADQYVISI